MNIMYEFEEMRWLNDKIPMKQLNTLHNVYICEILYSIQNDTPLVKEEESWMNQLLDCNYSQVDIDKS